MWKDGNIIVTTDKHKVRNIVTERGVEIDPLTYPDIFTFKNEDGTIFFGPYSIVRGGETTKGYENINHFGKYKVEIPKGTDNFIIEVTTKYEWPHGSYVMPSGGKIIYYRYLNRFKMRM